MISESQQQQSKAQLLATGAGNAGIDAHPLCAKARELQAP
jgi:hypothetical protein